MPSRKAITLLLRVVTPEGRRRYLRPVFTGGKLKPNWAVLAGKPTSFTGGIYAVRYWLNGRVVFESLGPDGDAALIAQRRIANRVEGILLGVVAAPVPVSETGGDDRVTLREAVNKYLHEVDRTKSPGTYASYNLSLEKFVASCKKRFLDELTRDDAQAFIVDLQRQGLSAHSICHRLQVLSSFLRRMDRPQLLKPREWPRFTDKPAVSYSREDISALLAAAKPEEQILYRFFLGSGFRSAELAVACYSDIDFQRGNIMVGEKKQYDFSPKSRRVRFVPLPDDLLSDLRARRDAHPGQSLIFPALKGGVQSNLLLPLKRLALRAGLNCGQCVTETGKTCRDNPVCDKWTLHSFRRSFATWHHNGGVSSAILKSWLGHSSLMVTERYLCGETTSEAKAVVNATFAGLLAARGPVLVQKQA
jgi:integrase